MTEEKEKEERRRVVVENERLDLVWEMVRGNRRKEKEKKRARRQVQVRVKKIEARFLRSNLSIWQKLLR